MSMMESLSTSRAALTPKELEVLQLLAAGHTVKSIAAQLDRSEASINERLRDARRKTGVGSSRELARLLNEQKNWDRNFGLPLQATRGESVATLPQEKRPGSKGTLAMLIALPLATLGLIATAADSPYFAAQPETAQSAVTMQSPLVGNWSLDLMRIPAEERPRSVTIAFRKLPDARWNTVVEIVGPEGSQQRAESKAALDGVAVPVTGTMGFIDSVSLRQPNPNTLVMTLGKDGRRVSTRVYTVSDDGKTMTETIVWAADGMPKVETTYFNRVP
jgi:DNA-binding CsgD family transcriptional regulator